MTTQEFSNAFDTLLASYSNKASFGDEGAPTDLVFDEYEKSVLLTQAQDIIVKQYFEDSNINVGFDGNARRQIDFSSLIDTMDLYPFEFYDSTRYVDDSYVYILPDNMLAILNEKVTIVYDGANIASYVIKPINYRDYDREMSKVWAQPLKKQAWRLISTNNIYPYGEKVEVIINDAAKAKLVDNSRLQYTIRYVKRPTPIVLADFSTSGLEIDGYNTERTSEVNPTLHIDILNKAVELAYATRAGKSTSQS